MLCDICKQAVATVHYTEIINNKIHKMDLCEGCAKEKNLGFNTQFSVADILKGLTETAQISQTPTETACPFCGLTYGKFKKIGRLGCGECYETFGSNLESIISDVHKNTQHLGKSPAAQSTDTGKTKTETVQDQIENLQEQLREAIEQELYEKAAKLRDTIRSLQNKEGSTS